MEASLMPTLRQPTQTDMQHLMQEPRYVAAVKAAKDSGATDSQLSVMENSWLDQMLGENGFAPVPEGSVIDPHTGQIYDNGHPLGRFALQAGLLAAGAGVGGALAGGAGAGTGAGTASSLAPGNPDVPASLAAPDPNVDLNAEFPPNTPSGTGTGTGTGTGSGTGVTDFLNSDLGKTLLSFGLGTASGALAPRRHSFLGEADPLGDQISNSIRNKQTQINQGVSFPDAGKIGQPPQFNGPSLPMAFGVTGGDKQGSGGSLFSTPPSAPSGRGGPAQGPEGVQAAFQMLNPGKSLGGL